MKSSGLKRILNMTCKMMPRLKFSNFADINKNQKKDDPFNVNQNRDQMRKDADKVKEEPNKSAYNPKDNQNIKKEENKWNEDKSACNPKDNQNIKKEESKWNEDKSASNPNPKDNQNIKKEESKWGEEKKDETVKKTPDWVREAKGDKTASTQSYASEEKGHFDASKPGLNKNMENDRMMGKQGHDSMKPDMDHIGESDVKLSIGGKGKWGDDVNQKEKVQQEWKEYLDSGKKEESMLHPHDKDTKHFENARLKPIDLDEGKTNRDTKKDDFNKKHDDQSRKF